MDKEQIFYILGIEETTDKDILKQAYRKKLVVTNPEDDPEGFQNLRTAYEEALALADQAEQEAEGPADTSPLGLWRTKMEEIYTSLSNRCNLECWKELLSDDVCVDLDTAEDARLSCIGFLAGHFYLPQEIWVYLDKEFRIREDHQNLVEHFPENFLSFAAFKIEHGEFFDFDLFEGEDRANYDGYMQQCINAKHVMDDNENFEEAKKLLDDLKAYHIYHPYEDVERMRIALRQEDLPEAEMLCDSLLLSENKNQYIYSQCGMVLEKAGRWEEADQLYREQCAAYPDNDVLLLGQIHCDLKMERWEEAKKKSLDLMDRCETNPTEDMMNCMKQANVHLIEEMQKKLEEEPDNFRERLELGWCYFQNERFDENVALLSSVEPPAHTVSEPGKLLPDCSNILDYNNLLGRTYLAMREFDKALPHLQTWTACILSLKETSKDEDNEEVQRRLERLPYAFFTQALCLQDKEDEESRKKAAEFFVKSVELEQDIGTRLSYHSALASFYLKIKDNERCIDACDQILKEDDGYFPAYTYRQEAYYNLHKPQEVVDDYHRATNIYQYYLKPYLLAAKVFYYYRQYQDSLDVIKRARDAGLGSNDLDFFEARNLRYTAKNREETEKVLHMCRDLTEKLNREDNDIEAPVDVYREILLCLMDMREYEKGLEEAEKAIRLFPDSDNLLWMKGDLLRRLRKDRDALNIYRTLNRRMENPALLNDIVECLMDLEPQSKEIPDFCEQILKLDPEDRKVNHHLTNYYQNLFNQTDQMEYYFKARPYASRQLELFPESCYYYVERGILYQDGYELEKALKDFQKAAELKPDDVYAYANWGLTLQLMDQVEESVEILEKSVELLHSGNEHTSFPLTCLAKTYVMLGRYDEAVALSQEVLNNYPTHSRTDLCRIYRRMGRPEKAYQLYEYEIQEKPQDADAINGLVHAHAEAGDTKFGINYYKKLLKKNENIDLIINAVDFYIDVLRDFKTAYKLTKKALKDMDRMTFSQKRSLLGNHIAACYYLKKTEDAKGYFNEFVSLFQKECGGFANYLKRASLRPARLFTLALPHLYTGQLDQAEAFFRSMLSGRRCKHCRYKACFEAHQGLGLLFEMQGKRKEAAEEFRLCLELDPYNWDALYAVRNGRPPAAEK